MANHCRRRPVSVLGCLGEGVASVDALLPKTRHAVLIDISHMTAIGEVSESHRRN